MCGKDEEHMTQLTTALKRIQAAGATLNAEKCCFAKTRLRFLGQTGIQGDRENISAIVGMKAPTTITELRRFMGMVNQLGKFSQNIAELSHPLWQLLSPKNSWIWGPAQNEPFALIKAELTKPTVLALYDLDAPTKIVADASVTDWVLF